MEKYSRRYFIESCLRFLIATAAPSQLVEVFNRKTIEQLNIGESCEGMAGFYTEDGCTGCNPQRITKSGEVYDETKFTLAFMRAPIGSLVEIENMLNGKRIRAVVNDQGGFEDLGRIADLSKASYDAVEGAGLIPTRITRVKRGGR